MTSSALPPGTTRAELALESSALVFDLGDPFDDRADLAVGVVEGGAVALEAAIAVLDLCPEGGLAFSASRLELIVAGEDLGGLVDVVVELLVEELVEPGQRRVLFDVDALRVLQRADGVVVGELAPVVGPTVVPAGLACAGRRSRSASVPASW